MNKLLIALCGFAALGMSGIANAGLHTNGYLNITSTSMMGTMNVRYNSSLPVSYMGGYGYANSSVTFYGRNENNVFFSCYVPTTSALYPQAVDAKNNLKNGSYLYVYKTTSSSECVSVFFRNSSDILD
jgi:hypothetical protein